jgi:hypothetical protein
MAEQLELSSELEPKGSVETKEKKKILDAEWCFQFFNNEPIVFAYSNEGEEASTLTLQINPIEGEGLTFKQNGMVFTIFPRQISEETKLERAKENQQ